MKYTINNNINNDPENELIADANANDTFDMKTFECLDNTNSHADIIIPINANIMTNNNVLTLTCPIVNVY